MAATYRIQHDTRYIYASPVATSQHVAYLRPRNLPYQQVRHQELRIDPAPARRGIRTDYFGNTVDQFQIVRPHSALLVSGESIVHVEDRTTALQPDQSVPWELVRHTLADRAGAVGPETAQFVEPSPYLPLSDEIDHFTRASFPAGEPVLRGAIDLMHRIHREFRFDPSATTVTTPLTRVLEDRRGVCQDFAHIAISGLRSLGLAARYVSGYLLTDPPPGQPRLIGSDASHAWLSVYCPSHGWVDLDPTNDVVVGERHVTVAWGRDYGDVSPLRGVLLGGSSHRLYVGVNVYPLEEIPASSASVQE